jgi:CRISPR-associated endonuclease/helicase Cas3
MNPTFPSIFHRATTNPPLPYQTRLATEGDTLPQLLDIPTGLGKTAAAVMAWVWRRRFASDAVRRQSPRRLVYCLPMRVLVEQTHQAATTWLKNLGLYTDEPKDRHPEWKPPEGDQGKHPIAVHLLMGGEDATDWALWPERDAVLIGTQDMLLSRALNRGYAAGRARWPMEFGLLNNDCLWVFDEVQLMGSGLATTAQLAAFRHNPPRGVGCYAPSGQLWMSATIQSAWFATVDHPRPEDKPFGLSATEKEKSAIDPGKRLHAVKLIHRAQNAVGAKVAVLAAEILSAHQEKVAAEGGLTLVIVNTVKRACELQAALEKGAKKHRASCDIVLIHSRYRPPDRKQLVDRLLSTPPAGGRIAVSTQVVEAGVDISAKVLFTELAPWTSLVQRFGRCNRRGEYDEADVFWFDVAEKDSAPYDKHELRDAREQLQAVEKESGRVGPAALPPVPLPYQPRHVIRRKDIVELFDTTPDLAGNDIDIARYIRDAEEHDVHVFWRRLPESGPPIDEPAAQRQELCPVPVGGFRKFIDDELKTSKHAIHKRSFRRNFLSRQWEAVTDHDQYVPGQIYLLDATAGGYDAALGWTGKTASEDSQDVTPNYVPRPESGDDANDRDDWSEFGWRTIAEHTDEVCDELGLILTEIAIPQAERTALELAARWHDWGKAHEVFQRAIHDGQPQRLSRPDAWRGCTVVAKAPGRRRGPSFWAKYERPHFRHELASALGVIGGHATGIPDELRDLVAYLVAAHHGKVRLSIRSLAGERRPGDVALFARGVWHGDSLPSIDLGGGVTSPAMTLDLGPMQLGLSAEGRPSWAERMLRLRDASELGIFRLAYLESLLRAADCRASIKAEHAGELNHV